MSIHSVNDLAAPSYSHAFNGALSLEDLRTRTPAVFAESASERTKKAYKFISSAEVVRALMDAGFEPSAARQTRSRRGSDPLHARHMIRLRHARETISIADSIGEICLINAHDGPSAYRLLAGLYRPVCTNGLLCRMGDFAMIRVPHRSSVAADVVAGALAITAQFGEIRTRVEGMAARELTDVEQLKFADEAFEIRYANVEQPPAFAAERLLEARRSADAGSSLWLTYNRLQLSVVAGGLPYHSRSRRLVSMRRIHSIREDIRVNVALWQAACRYLAA